MKALTTPAAILQTVLSKKGQFGSVTISKKLKTRKGVHSDISKTTKMSVRAGIEYDNLSIVKEKRETGELPKENQGLPFGTWVAYPYLIEHKGEHYLRLYPNGKPKTVYFQDGKETSLDYVKDCLLASELPKSGDPDCITVKLANVVELV